MFHKVKEVRPLENYVLSVQFGEGVVKEYDLKTLMSKVSFFDPLKENDLFKEVKVDSGGYGVSWTDDIDLSSEELWNNGVEIKTPFDGLISFSDATELWNLHESTLRKAIVYGKLALGLDVCKFGKQWVISIEAMKREYGQMPQKE